MTIQDWKLSRDSVALAQILTFKTGTEQTKIVSKALDGSTYIQTIGDGTRYANVSIIATREETDLVEAAEADGALVSCVYRDVQYFGYIEDPPDWEAVQPGYWYRATIKLLIDEEVSM